jgi:hypothetical protein
MGAIISVSRSDEACAGIAEAYRGMGLSFDPGTYGAISDLKPSVSFAEVKDVFMKSVAAALRQA